MIRVQVNIQLVAFLSILNSKTVHHKEARGRGALLNWGMYTPARMTQQKLYPQIASLLQARTGFPRATPGTAGFAWAWASPVKSRTNPVRAGP